MPGDAFRSGRRDAPRRREFTQRNGAAGERAVRRRDEEGLATVVFTCQPREEDEQDLYDAPVDAANLPAGLAPAAHSAVFAGRAADGAAGAGRLPLAGSAREQRAAVACREADDAVRHGQEPGLARGAQPAAQPGARPAQPLRLDQQLGRIRVLGGVERVQRAAAAARPRRALPQGRMVRLFLLL